MSVTKGQKVLVKNLSISFSDYRNLAGEVLDVEGEIVRVAVDRNKISTEDLRDLRKDKNANRVVVSVKSNNLV